MRRIFLLYLCLLAMTSAALAGAQEPPVDVPSRSALVEDADNLALKLDLDHRYVELSQRFERWQAEAKAYNGRYGGRTFDEDSPEAKAGAAEQERLARVLQEYEHDAELFKADVAMLRLEPETVAIMKGMTAAARHLKWSDEKVARLQRALKKLDDFGDPNATKRIRQTWQDILARPTEKLAPEASHGSGPGFAGAGKQTVYQDCTIFALANATGRPYGVVAASATGLIGEGTWRSPEERAHPEKVFSSGGLNGGEVIMLAELYGKAEVIPRESFAKTLKGGRPVLVAVVPSSGDGSHEVVLTKAFRHEGQMWYEMMESYQGPQRRLYLSGSELSTILRENGVAFSPESGRTPKLLRKEGE